MGKILIIPDVHGRRFWKDACLNHKDDFEKIVFLGDYVSPYPYEEISNKKAIDVFEEVEEPQDPRFAPGEEYYYIFNKSDYPNLVFKIYDKYYRSK